MSTDSLPNAGNDLIRIHKVITRALDVSLQNCRESKLNEELHQGFMKYVKALTILLNSHHLGEDEITFPYWRTKLNDAPFDLLIDQHQQMIVYLEQIESLLDKGTTSLNSDKLNKLHQALTGLNALWHTHIALEEETVGPKNALTYLTLEENVELVKKLAEHGQAHSQPIELVMPFVVYNLADDDRTEFTRLLPAVMVQQLMPVVWKEAWEPMKPFLLLE